LSVDFSTETIARPRNSSSTLKTGCCSCNGINIALETDALFLGRFLPLGAASIGGLFVFRRLRPIATKRERSEKWNGSPSGNVSVKTEFGPKVARQTEGPSE
jgi:hypothetical protein